MTDLKIPGSPDRTAREGSFEAEAPPKEEGGGAQSWDEYFVKAEGVDALVEPEASPDVVTKLEIGDYVRGDFSVLYAGADVTNKVSATALTAVDKSLGELAISLGRKWVDLGPDVEFDPSTRVRL